MSSSNLSISSTARLRSGYDMPLLGFGVYQNYHTAASCLEAFSAGYRHVDSAQAYRNEAHVGQAVKECGIRREELFITTKCISKTHGYDSTLVAVDTSLARFDLKYIDLYLIHDPFSGKVKRLETYKALLECKQAGKVRSVGVSNFGVHHLEEIKSEGYEMPSVNQIELHPFCQQTAIVDYCHAHNIVVQAYCPLVRAQQLEHEVVRDIAVKHAHDSAQILLRWSLQKGFIPLPKSTKPARIHSNTHLYDFILDANDMARLDALDRGKDGAISWNPVDTE